MSKNYILAFTLVELLVVISIIGVLATLVLVSFTASQKQARDTQRKSDIKQYQTALENYANRNNGYFPQRPVAYPGLNASSTLCTTDLKLSTCPEDPKNTSDSSFVYKYQSDGTVSDGTPKAVKYVLWAKLENTSDYFVVCSNGVSGTKAQSAFTVSGGNCPI